MTNEEAIEILEANRPDPCYQMLREAVDFAVNALKAQDVTGTNVGNNGDTIYRQDAIRTLEDGKYSTDYCKEHGIDHSINMEMVRILLNDLPSAQPDPQPTCNNLATDCISRQAAIDALYKMLHDYFWADDEELDAAIATLNDLPSVQPEPLKITIDPPTADELERIKHAMRNTPVMLLPSAQPEIKPVDIDYYYCSNAMLKMWIDNVLTDGEYNKIMDKLNDFELRRREKENG